MSVEVTVPVVNHLPVKRYSLLGVGFGPGDGVGVGCARGTRTHAE